MWIIKPKNAILGIGRLFFITGFGGLAIKKVAIKYQSTSGESTAFDLSVSDSSTLIDCTLWGIGIVGAIILLGKVIYIVYHRRKTLILGIEHIALKDKIATPLSTTLSQSYQSKVETIPIDLSKYYEHDKLSNPQDALALTKVTLESTLKSKAAEIGNKEIIVVYGGTPPVGLGFLAGYLMPNTYHVEVWDYDRNAKKGKNWYKLAGYSDENKPKINLSNYNSADKEVCLLMGISHPVTIEQIRGKVSCPSYVEITMPEVKYDSMSSIEKLTAFEKEFGELLKKLAADGVEKIHIFCAAQASFNFCMGRQITRNHPEIIVYEYDISLPEKYSWGVLLNTKDSCSPAIIS